MKKTKEKTQKEKNKEVKEKINNLRVCTDSEFYTQILPATNPKSYADYKKVIFQKAEGRRQKAEGNPRLKTWD